MTVFVVQESPGKNLIPAMEYGKIKVLCRNGDRPFSVDDDVRRMYDELTAYTPVDYILPIGDPVLIGIAVTLAAERTGGKIRILKYDRQERKYIPITLDLAKIIREHIHD